MMMSVPMPMYMRRVVPSGRPEPAGSLRLVVGDAALGRLERQPASCHASSRRPSSWRRSPRRGRPAPPAPSAPRGGRRTRACPARSCPPARPAARARRGACRGSGRRPLVGLAHVDELGLAAVQQRRGRRQADLQRGVPERAHARSVQTPRAACAAGGARAAPGAPAPRSSSAAAIASGPARSRRCGGGEKTSETPPAPRARRAPTPIAPPGPRAAPRRGPPTPRRPGIARWQRVLQRARRPAAPYSATGASSRARTPVLTIDTPIDEAPEPEGAALRGRNDETGGPEPLVVPGRPDDRPGGDCGSGGGRAAPGRSVSRTAASRSGSDGPRAASRAPERP